MQSSFSPDPRFSTRFCRWARLATGVNCGGGAPTMQERQPTGAAEQSAPAWYLLHDDSQFGPLSDRELLLLAQRGGLKADDLLWRSGSEDWKPVHEVCGVTAPSAITP